MLCFGKGCLHCFEVTASTNHLAHSLAALCDWGVSALYVCSTITYLLLLYVLQRISNFPQKQMISKHLHRRDVCVISFRVRNYSTWIPMFNYCFPIRL